MAAQDRTADNTLTDNLLKKWHRFSFFQAVQLLERAIPEAAQVGHGGDPSKEIIRFRPDASLAFPDSDIVSIEELPASSGGKRYRITISFLGLYGSSSPMPTYFTEDILWDEGYSTRVRDFLDIFHHRLISLFYRTWSKYRYYIQFRKGGSDPLSKRLMWLIGQLDEEKPAEEENRKEKIIPPIRLLKYAGAMTQQPRSASVLEGILMDYFEGIPVSIKQCIERRAIISDRQRNALAEKNCTLGNNFTMGGTLADRSGKFRIVVGPINYEKLGGFLPGSRDYRAVREILDAYLVDGLDYDMEVQIRAQNIPGLKLSGSESESETTGLGRNTWLSTPLSETVSVFFGFNPSEAKGSV